MTWISLQNPTNHLDLAMSQSREIGLCFCAFSCQAPRPYFLKFMMTSSNENSTRITDPLSCVCGEFTDLDHQWIPLTNWWSANSPHRHDKGPVMRPVNERLSKQSWGWIFETSSHPLWRHCNVSGFSVTYGGSKVTGTIYFCNWGTPVNKRISHIFIGGPYMIISARAPYEYLEGEAPRILGLTRTIHFRNWGIPINMKFPI